MDPNVSVSFFDKILQNPQNWISFLTLIFTIIVGLSALLSVLVGFFTIKKFWELREQHLNITQKIKEEDTILQKTREEYALLKDMLLQVAFEPDLSRNRELLDACIHSLESKGMLVEGTLEAITPAIYFVSERGAIQDAQRIVKIFRLASNSGIEELVSNCSKAFNRMKLDISKSMKDSAG